MQTWINHPWVEIYSEHIHFLVRKETVKLDNLVHIEAKKGYSFSYY